jgi:single-stranded-DNA-specific exonuclease
MEHALPRARERFGAFLDQIPASARTVVFCHNDADGLAAGALLGRGLGRLGRTAVAVVPSLRGESAFSPGARERLAALDPAALIVADLGVHRDGVLPGIATLLIDHHQPAGEPHGAVVVSGYGWEPIPASAWLTYELLHPLAPMEDLSWIGAVGTMSDLGDSAPWPELPALRKQWTTKWLKEAVVLINAARRASAFDIATPLRLLLEAEHPRQVSEDRDLGAERLHAYRAEVFAELQQARRAAPSFSSTGPYALVRLNSACQVHPLIAQQWRGRLPKYAVIAANTGYVAGDVAFSMRTARTDLDLPRLLQGLELGDYQGRFGFGHDQASGGHLPPDAFERMLDLLGFSRES